MKSFYVECSKQTNKEDTCLSVNLSWADVRDIVASAGSENSSNIPPSIRGKIFSQLVEKKLATVYDMV